MSRENTYFDLKLSKADLDVFKLGALADLLTLPLGIEQVVLAGATQKLTVSYSNRAPKFSEEQMQAFSDKLPDEFSLQITLAPGFFYLIENNRFYLTHQLVQAVDARIDVQTGEEKKPPAVDDSEISLIEILTYPGLDKACNYLLSLIQILK